MKLTKIIKSLNEGSLKDTAKTFERTVASDPALSSNGISAQKRKLIDRFHKEYSDKMNRKFAKNLKDMVGMTFESGVPSYVKNIPVKSAKFDIRPYFDGHAETILKITFENGKTIEKDVQRYYSQPGVF